MLKVFIRWSPRANTLRRPGWYTDGTCLHNATEVLGGPGSHLTLLADGDPPGYIRDLPWDSVMRLPDGTNSQSLQRCLDMALATCHYADTIYLVEQDYLHTPQAQAVLADGIALNPEGYVTLFDDPLYYWPSADVAHVSADTRLIVGTTRHWRTVPSTTMTFAAPAWVIDEDRAVIARALIDTVKPPDRTLWREISRAGRTLLSSIPAAATHVETTALAPLVDWRALTRADGARLPASDMWRRKLAAVTEVSVGSGVPAFVLDRLHEFGVRTISLHERAVHTREDPWWALVTATEKHELDIEARARGTALVGVIVCSELATYSGRWYSGRDWSLADLLEAKSAGQPVDGDA